MKFKNGKLIECSNGEYAYITKVYNNSSCLAVAIDNLRDYIESKLYELGCKYPSNAFIKTVSFNVLSAVINNYKYLKVVNG